VFKRFIRSLVAACFAVGAVAQAQPDTVTVSVEKGDFSAFTRYSAPKIPCPADVGAAECDYRLTAARDAHGKVTWVVTLWVKYSHRWRFYDELRLLGGVQIPAAEARRQPLSCYRGSCEFLELVTFGVPDANVTAGAALRVQFQTRQHLPFEGEIPASHAAAIQERMQR
jgi:hypothetical protein